MILGNLINLDS